MPKGVQPIFTQTASGSSPTITFNNIPQTFTDLKIVASMRTAAAVNYDYIYGTINDLTPTQWLSEFYGTGTTYGGSSTTGATGFRMGYANGASALSNTCSVSTLYIPNYTQPRIKSGLLYSVQENSTTTNAVQTMSTVAMEVYSPIVKLSFTPNSAQNFTNLTTFTLYGISR